MRSNAIIKKTLQNKLRKHRRLAKMTQEDLAEKIGMSRAYVGYIEQGRNIPSLNTIDKIARALKIKVSELIE